MPQFLHTLLAFAVSCLGAIFATAASAAIMAPPVDGPTAVLAAAEWPDIVRQRSVEMHVASLSVLYIPTCRCCDHGRVLPDWLTAPASLTPTGSLTWAGIEEAATIATLAQPQKESDKAAGINDFARDGSPDVELLTAIPAPEPPAMVMAGLALAAGGLVWNRKRARRAGSFRQLEPMAGQDR